MQKGSIRHNSISHQSNDNTGIYQSCSPFLHETEQHASVGQAKSKKRRVDGSETALKSDVFHCSSSVSSSVSSSLSKSLSKSHAEPMAMQHTLKQHTKTKQHTETMEEMTGLDSKMPLNQKLHRDEGMDVSCSKNIPNPLASKQRILFKKVIQKTIKQAQSVLTCGSSKKAAKKNVSLCGSASHFSDSACIKHPPWGTAEECVQELESQFLHMDAQVQGTLKNLTEMVDKTYESFTHSLSIQGKLLQSLAASQSYASPKHSPGADVVVGLGSSNSSAASSVLNTTPAAHSTLASLQAMTELRQLKTQHAELKNRYSLLQMVCGRNQETVGILTNLVKDLRDLHGVQNMPADLKQRIGQVDLASSDTQSSPFLGVEYKNAVKNHVVKQRLEESRDMQLLYDDNVLLYRKVQELLKKGPLQHKGN
jgi:hypothetical protein